MCPKPPTEQQEQTQVCAWLELHGVCFAAVPNGGHLARGWRGWRRLERAGARKGVPDLLIFTPPPANPSCRGVAVEMKRRKGGRLEPLQQYWQGRLTDCGWIALVGWGADDAIEQLQRGLGYGRRA